MKREKHKEEQVRVCPDSRDASKDYTLPKSEALALYDAGKLALDVTNSTPEKPVYMPVKPEVKSASRQALDDAEAYIKEHLVACCAEVVDLHKSGVLCPGHVRAAARIYAKALPGPQALKMALDATAKLAMAQVAGEKPPTQWKRTCQECLRWQFCPPPTEPITLAFRNKKCIHCKSEALDYGSGGWTMVEGKLVRGD